MDRQIYEENNVPYIIATQGDTYSIIAKEYNLFTGEVLSFNDLKKDVTIETGTIVYIKRKKKLGTDNTYVVASGETMYFISQKKGIRLESLYELNKMNIGTEPETGTILNLRK
ncbi:MAG: LysM peptidoglycan-binding domain-containing protein [Bacteroidales bacterium]